MLFSSLLLSDSVDYPKQLSAVVGDVINAALYQSGVDAFDLVPLDESFLIAFFLREETYAKSYAFGVVVLIEVSYIGQGRAAASNAVLFLEECDVLLG